MRDAGVGPVRRGDPRRATGEALEAALPGRLRRMRGRPAPAPRTRRSQERLRRHLRAMLGREAALGSALVPTHFERGMESATAAAPVAPGVVVTGHGRPPRRRRAAGRRGARGQLQALRRGLRPRRATTSCTRLQLPALRDPRAARRIGAEPAGGLYMGILSPRITGAVCDDVAGAPRVARPRARGTTGSGSPARPSPPPATPWPASARGRLDAAGARLLLPLVPLRGPVAVSPPDGRAGAGPPRGGRRASRRSPPGRAPARRPCWWRPCGATSRTTASRSSGILVAVVQPGRRGPPGRRGCRRASPMRTMAAAPPAPASTSRPPGSARSTRWPRGSCARTRSPPASTRSSASWTRPRRPR